MDHVARNRNCRFIVAIAMMGVLTPTPLVHAETPPLRPAASQIPDVRLDAQRRFHGVVVDGQGQVLTGAKVVLTRTGEQTKPAWSHETATDRHGRFQFESCSGGTYRLETSAGVYLCRLWTPNAAPPAAAPSLLVVNDNRVERGQRPIGEIFHSDPLLMATIVAAAIAIPIAVHKSRDDSPEGS